MQKLARRTKEEATNGSCVDMTNNERFLELLTKADHAMFFAARDLHDALKVANPVECILVEKYLKDACELKNRLAELRGASNASTI